MAIWLFTRQSSLILESTDNQSNRWVKQDINMKQRDHEACVAIIFTVIRVHCQGFVYFDARSKK